MGWIGNDEDLEEIVLKPLEAPAGAPAEIPAQEPVPQEVPA